MERPSNSTFCWKHSHFLGLNFSPYCLTQIVEMRFGRSLYKTSTPSKKPRAIFQFSVKDQIDGTRKRRGAVHRTNAMRMNSKHVIFSN